MTAIIKRIAIAMLVSAVPLLAGASPTLAQGDITVSVTDVEGRDEVPVTNELTNTPLNLSECEMDINITVDLREVDASSTLIDVWRSTGNDCSDETQRSGDTATCISLSEVNIDIAGSTDKLGNVFGVGSLVPCEDGTYTIYFLAADSAMSTGAVTNYGTLDIAVDTTGPSPVTNLMAGDGESSISLTWELPTDSDIDHLEIYGEVGTCADTTLKMNEGMSVPSERTVINANVASSAQSASVTAEELGLNIGDEAALGVVTVDTAGNASVLAVACGTRVQTDGFCDVYEAETGQACPDECGVRAPGVERNGGPLGLALGAVALLLWRRRR